MVPSLAAVGLPVHVHVLAHEPQARKRQKPVDCPSPRFSGMFTESWLLTG